MLTASSPVILIGEIFHAVSIKGQFLFFVVRRHEFLDLIGKNPCLQFLTNEGTTGILKCHYLVETENTQDDTHVVRLIFDMDRLDIEILTHFLVLRDRFRSHALHVDERHFLFKEQLFHSRTRHGHPGII